MLKNNSGYVRKEQKHLFLKKPNYYLHLRVYFFKSSHWIIGYVIVALFSCLMKHWSFVSRKDEETDCFLAH